MILAIDIGNTHIEIGLYNEAYIDSWRITTGVLRTEDEMMAFIQQFLTMRSVAAADISDLAISSVVPNITHVFQRMSEKYFQKTPLVVDHTLNLGITIKYEPPQSVGADRLCVAVGAFEKYGGPNIVVDIGTATTFDVVSGNGEYLGGVIAPGLETAARSLDEKAAKLPRIAYQFPPSVIGSNTEMSMQSGLMLGTVKMIDGLLELISEEVSGDPVIIATGGLSPLLMPRSQYLKHLEPELVLDGLMRIYRRNRKLQ